MVERSQSFFLGMFLGSTIALAVAFALGLGHPQPRVAKAQVRSSGVSSVMKDLRCGFGNEAVPHFLSVKGNGLGRVMVDIGLFTGNETFAAVKAGFTVYSFDPVTKFTKALGRRLSRANLDVVEVMLDASGKLMVPLPPPNPGRGISYIFNAGVGSKHEVRTIAVLGQASSFVDPNTVNSKGSESQRIQIVPLDDYIKTDVYFMKIDTQGFEMEVLHGARGVFRNHHVRVTSLELFPQGLRGAKTGTEALVRHLTEELDLMCFSSEPENAHSLKVGHPEETAAFLKAVDARDKEMKAACERCVKVKCAIPQMMEACSSIAFGFFDDLTCVPKTVRASTEVA